MVLLTNNGILPLQEDYTRIAVIGPSSASQKIGGYSSKPYGYTIRSVYDELKARYPRAEIRQCDGCAITHNDGETVHYVDGQPHLTTELDADIADMIEQAVEIAREAEIAILVCGDNLVTSGEGHDRSRLVLCGRQRELILRVAETGTPVVLVLENGKAMDLSAETEACAAMVVAGFGGEFGAKAIVETLAGDINPAGRLTVSYPRDEGMVPCYYTRLPGASCDYLEGDRSPLYPFGHGLSYTKFAYSDLALNPLGGCDCEVSFTVTNVGSRDGDEVVQVYINDPDSSVVTPEKLLRKFKRITLAAGESRKVTFTLGFDDLKLLGLDWQWKVEPGEFRVMVGASSADIRLEGSFEVE
jgi:beta-glucosidase